LGKKWPSAAFSCDKNGVCGLWLEPGLNGFSAVFSFPLFQLLVVAAFGLDNFAGVRVVVLLDLTSAAGAFF